jgi:hypothetical protein
MVSDNPDFERKAPFLADHLAPVRREPQDIFHASTPDARTLEEAAPAETGMGFSELDELADE